MDGMTVLWIVLAVVVVLILVGVIMAAIRGSRERRLEMDRQRAYEHRQQALKSAAEARRLSAPPGERREAAEQARQKMGQHARRVDAFDPDRDPKAAEQTERNGGHPTEAPPGAHRAPQTPDHPAADDQRNGQVK
jgi:type II secretory pathway pseudopilin PulG